MIEKTFKTYFDKIYCLNFIEAPERKDCIIKQLSKLHLLDGVEFNYGMPFMKIKSMSKHITEICKDGANFMAENSIGCAYNHYSAIKTAYCSGANSVLIFEDDTSFLKDRNTIISYLDELPEDWDYIYFTPTIPTIVDNLVDVSYCAESDSKYIDLRNFVCGSNFHDDLNSNNYYLYEGWISSCAYALNRRAMELYINLFEGSKYMHNSDGIQYFFNNISQSPLKSYTTNIRLFAQMSEVGIIDRIENNLIHYNKTEFGFPLQSNLFKDNFFYFSDQNNSIVYDRQINIDRNYISES